MLGVLEAQSSTLRNTDVDIATAGRVLHLTAQLR